MNVLKANAQNPPNPAKLLDSLRSTGYDNYNAIADIIDNSIDANATEINIEIHHQQKDFVITIADNGKGMDLHTLDEALKLGSETEKDFVSDLGRFGMGLSTASLSMCERTTVITKGKGGELLKSITDLEWVRKENSFTKFLGKADAEDAILFNELLKNDEQGTIVILSNSDRIQNSNVSVFANTLKNNLSRIFRRFIIAGKEFKINGENISASDPLMLNHELTRVYSDEIYDINIQKGDSIYEDTIRIKMVILPKQEIKGFGINEQNQGFYVMRNERELFAGSTLDGVFKKDPHLNRFRAEISFTGALDNLMGVHFTKRSLSIDQALKDKIIELVGSQIRQIKNIADSERIKSGKSLSHDDSEKLISKKSKLLITPPAEKIEKDNQQRKRTQEKENNNKEKREGISEKLHPVCRFEERSMEKVGPLYYPFMEGKKVVIQWNSDHPFYKLLIDKKEDKTFVTAVDFLIFSMSSAELKTRDDDNLSMFQDMRMFLSQNLRVLID